MVLRSAEGEGLRVTGRPPTWGSYPPVYPACRTHAESFVMAHPKPMAVTCRPGSPRHRAAHWMA